MTEAQKRPYHHGDLRQAILETAIAMLNEPGGWQFTLREVARRAGVSHAAPYKHFPDKAALLNEIALIGFDRLHVALASARSSAGNAAEALAAASRAYLVFGLGNPALYRLMFGAEIGNSAAVHRDRRAMGAFDVVMDLLAEGQAAGLIEKRGVAGQAASVWAQMHGLTMLKLDGMLRPERVGEDAVEAALASFFEGVLV
ncbi:MAG TPA: TetR/AcrR family transcriptional regulator [Albidovulum sp.]|uniref:TetR/AcrR family transcriptional regulator n=1 Tax=Albidovulum sp. TaxID=1872424 RepID=UPI002C69713F|nr:TetR/AcrR family transcriptional regulator [Albidovulum sp.]